MRARFVPHTVLALSVALALIIGTSAAALSQTAKPATPARIVSTSPSITETLFALGLGDRVVGVSTFCRYPAAVVGLPKVGTFMKPDAETIARLRPDLVFVYAGLNSAAAQLRTLGIATETVDRGALPTVFSAIHQIGNAAGVPDRADHLVRELTAELDQLKTAVATRPPRSVLIIVGRRPGTLTDLVAVGPGSYLHDLATIAGGKNVLASAALAYPRISMETVISLRPDVIIDAGEMGESPASADRRLQVTAGLWRAQTLVQAAREGAVHATTDDAFVVPGPRLIDVARQMAFWFHGVKAQ